MRKQIWEEAVNRSNKLQTQRNELLAALRVAEDYMSRQMDEAETMDHALDAHDEDMCVLCTVRAAIAKVEGKGQ